MLTNDQMKANRYLTWQNNRRIVAFIKTNLEAGRTITLTTYGRQTRCTKKHIDMFKATKSGAYIQAGKGWDCINGCKIQAWA